MSDTPSQSNSDEENKTEKKDSDPLSDLPPIPEEAKKKTEADPADEETKVLELVPVLEDEPAPDKDSPHQFTIIGGDGDEYGPKPIEDVLLWIRTGRASARTLVRPGTDSQWQHSGKSPCWLLSWKGPNCPRANPAK